MINQVIIAGRLTQDPKMVETSGPSYCLLRVASQRAFKNKDGQYDTDFFDVKTWSGNSQNVYENCKKGSIVVCFGRLVPIKYVNKENKTVYGLDIVAEKVIHMGKTKKAEDLGAPEENDFVDLDEEDED